MLSAETADALMLVDHMFHYVSGLGHPPREWSFLELGRCFQAVRADDEVAAMMLADHADRWMAGRGF